MASSVPPPLLSVPAKPRIQLLDDAVQSRIAAGEVVERPASVVKELVENALDAGAKNIFVELEEGGKTLIRVRDDGSGMDAGDLALSIRHHATSKLRQADELFGLHTLGFRGEALPSIASVAHFSITTRQPNSEHAWAIKVDGGKAGGVQPASSAPGTAVEVRDLFYNLPARQRFLKGQGPEAAACAEVLTRLSLLRPDVGFFLKQGRQEILSCPAWKASSKAEEPADSIAPAGWAGPFSLPMTAYLHRAKQALGRMVQELEPFEFQIEVALPVDPLQPQAGSSAAHARLFGLLSPPAKARPNRSSIYLAVNARPVKDRTFTTALQEAYRQLLPPKRFPAAVLFLELPGSEVDINVHPAKAEVRFRHPNLLFSLVHQAVRNTFSIGPASETIQEPSAPVQPMPSRPIRSFQAADLWKTLPQESQRFDPPVLQPVFDVRKEKSSSLPSRIAEAPAAFGLKNPVIPTVADVPRNKAIPDQAGRMEPPLPLATNSVEIPAPDFRILGQAAGSYIVIEDAEGVKLIDQHALHERILFEGLLEKSRQGHSAGSQQLLVPEQLELTPEQAGAWSDPGIRNVLAELGFDLEDFGPRTLILRAFPMALRGHKALVLAGQLLESLGKGSDAALEGLPPATFATLREKAIYIMSCKGAIKAGERLTQEQMAALLSEFFRLTQGRPLPPGARSVSRFTCPHGRPLALELTWDEIDRKVGR